MLHDHTNLAKQLEAVLESVFDPVEHTAYVTQIDQPLGAHNAW